MRVNRVRKTILKSIKFVLIYVVGRIPIIRRLNRAIIIDRDVFVSVIMELFYLSKRVERIKKYWLLNFPRKHEQRAQMYAC